MSLVPPLENIQRGEKCRFDWLPAGDTFRSAIFLGLSPLVVFGLSPVSSRCRPCWKGQDISADSWHHSCSFAVCRQGEACWRGARLLLSVPLSEDGEIISELLTK